MGGRVVVPLVITARRLARIMLDIEASSRILILRGFGIDVQIPKCALHAGVSKTLD